MIKTQPLRDRFDQPAGSHHAYFNRIRLSGEFIPILFLLETRFGLTAEGFRRRIGGTTFRSQKCQCSLKNVRFVFPMPHLAAGKHSGKTGQHYEKEQKEIRALADFYLENLSQFYSYWKPASLHNRIFT